MKDSASGRFTITIEAFEAKVATEKSEEMRTTTRVLGIFTDAMEFQHGEITTFPAPMTVARMIDTAEDHLAQDSMTPAQASKLRGLAQWTDSEVMGRPARSCLRLLAERQYGSGSHLSDSLRWALQCLL